MNWVRALVVMVLGSVASAAEAESCATEDSCWEEYREAVLMRDNPSDIAAGLNALVAGCEAEGAARACRVLGYFTSRGLTEQNHGPDRDMFLKACRGGDGPGCAFLVDRVLPFGAWSDSVDDAMLAFLVETCGAGDDFVCRSLSPRLSQSAAVAMLGECRAPDEITCILGTERGAGSPERQETRYREACAAGAGIGCMFLAQHLAQGAGADLAKPARPFWRRACDLGVGHACNLLFSDPTDETEADLNRYLKTSCNAGHPPACLSLSWRVTASGDRGKRRYVTGLQDDCLSGNPRSCEKAAKWLDIWKSAFDLKERFDDIDQVIENHFTFAEFLNGRR